MIPSRLWFVVVATLVVAAAAATGWKRHADRQAWEALRPALPAPRGAATPGLDTRLAACHRRLAAWPADRAALAEFTRLCHANGLLDAAMAGYRALGALEPAEPRWPYLLASILAGYGRLDEALPLYRRTTVLAPDHALAWLRLGDALLKSNALDEAARAYETARRLAPDDANALLGLARCDLQAERFTAARLHLQQAVALQPGFAEALSLLASVFERLGNPEAAATARGRMPRQSARREPPDPWRDGLLPYSHDPYLLLVAAGAAALSDTPRAARPYLDRALAVAPGDARVQRQSGNNRLALGDLPAARRHLEKAAALAPSDDAVWLDLLAVLRKQADDPAQASALAAALAACPGSAGLQFEAGVLALRQDRPEDAIPHLAAAWRLQPEEPGAALALAKLYFRLARPDDGFAVLEAIVARHPGQSDALALLVREGLAHGDPRIAGWRRLAAAAPTGDIARRSEDPTGENLP